MNEDSSEILRVVDWRDDDGNLIELTDEQRGMIVDFVEWRLADEGLLK